MLLLFIVTAFLLVYAFLIFYYWYHWEQLKSFSPYSTKPSTFLSVVIAARNEEKNLLTLLESLQLQSYPKHMFEIIIVDDFSTDATSKVLQSFINDQITLIKPNTDAESSSKKKSIEAGVMKARGELIVITDADCIPPVNWLTTIESFYKRKAAKFIAAPVKYVHDNSMLQLFQAIDFMTLQGITAANVHADFHRMCNGANLAYERQTFIEVSGFEGIDNVASGDDMLLMHKIWKQHPEKIAYLKSKEAIVTTQPMLSWKDFLMQRRRWASKTLYYDDNKIITVLAFVYFLNLLFFVLVIVSIIYPYYWPLVLFYLIGKTLIEIPFVNSIAKFYDEQKIIRYFIFLQPLHIIYTVIVGLISQFGKYDWKGRKTK